MLATSEAELQELVDRQDRVSRKYSLGLLINVDKTKVMASDGMAHAAYSFRMSNCNFTVTGSQKPHQSCPLYEKFHRIYKKIP